MNPCAISSQIILPLGAAWIRPLLPPSWQRAPARVTATQVKVLMKKIITSATPITVLLLKMDLIAWSFARFDARGKANVTVTGKNL